MSARDTSPSRNVFTHNSSEAGEAAKPITVTVQSARRLLGLGNTSIWKLIGEGRLETIRVGRRRLILYRSIEDLITSGSDAV
jgi:excisionase family DNA binding protein